MCDYCDNEIAVDWEGTIQDAPEEVDCPTCHGHSSYDPENAEFE